MTKLAKIQLTPANKAELTTYVANVKNELLSGGYDPLQVAGLLKSMEELTKALRADTEIKEMIQQEADKHPGKTIDLDRFKITKTARASYDYSSCEDAVYDSLVAEMDTLKAQIKAREEMLKTGVNPETGEVFAKPVKKSTDVISVSLK